jgi:hypothetical protein
MRVLFIGALAATLVSCTAVPDSERIASRKSVAAKVDDKKNATLIPPKKTKAVAKAAPDRSATPARAAQSKKDHPTTEKAKVAVAAMLGAPGSAEFYKLQRAQKSLLHRTYDTVCGYVKTKNTAGGGMPFLYVVDREGGDETYLINGRSHVAATVHGAFCN